MAVAAQVVAAGLLLLIGAAAGAASPAAGHTFTLPVAVSAAAGEYTPQPALKRWRNLAARRSLGLTVRRTTKPPAADAGGVTIAPLRAMVGTIPALQVLRLPFFYRDEAAVHRALDGGVGRELRAAARADGWRLLAVWDDGMTAMSGNEPYNVLPNLAGIQFALVHPDRLTKLELNALGSWTRVIGAGGVARMGRECVVSSRSATPREILREKLYRVQLDMTLTRDRYQGWVVAMPEKAWQGLPSARQAALAGTLADVTRWQRSHAARLQRSAVQQLQRAGLAVHPMTAAQRRRFRARVARWEVFLPADLRNDAGRALVRTAAAAAAPAGVSRRPEALSDAQPAAPASQRSQ